MNWKKKIPNTYTYCILVCSHPRSQDQYNRNSIPIHQKPFLSGSPLQQPIGSSKAVLFQKGSCEKLNLTVHNGEKTCFFLF